MPEPEVIDAEVVDVTEDMLPAQLPAVPEQAAATLFRTDEPGEIVRRATEVADQLARVLRDRNLTTNIQGREHVRVEGWTFCGTMLGVFPVVVWTRQVDDGWEARVEARTLAGAVVGAAEAECLRSEKTWAKRDDYALRSMAQTRATSKALRGPLGFVVSLAGFDPTPEEEMPRDAAVPTAAVDPGTVMPAGFTANRQLANQIGKALKHVDPTVDWLGTWDHAIAAHYNTTRAELTREQAAEAWTRLANVAATLDADGDFPPPTEEEIQWAFAEAFAGVVVKVEIHEPAVDPEEGGA